MCRPLKLTTFFLVYLLLIRPVQGQRQRFSDIRFDSSAAAQARAALNNLPDTGYQKKVYHKDGVQLPYRLLVPLHRQPYKKYPLVITLHNSSRLGSDNERQLEPLARIWLRRDIRKKYPAFVAAPQFAKRSSNYAMDSSRGVLEAFPSADVPIVLDLVAALVKTHPEIDDRRIYIVGYSMGASTAQHLLSLDPGRFAALVTIAGVPDFSNTGGIADKPVWLVHGREDDENPYPGSVALFNLLKKNRRLLFTTFNHLNHNTITLPFLLNDALPAWLFKQKR
ncbi:hypothetical protein [Niabella beijingensis]|uniref:carboxylesterase family protein n=1 Tax=Niabella beijingensis TaxID=2872700 RepID=UPI001CBB54A7|nr:hypothetical protein [Niabella beijingensis]MBZ4187911.1 hypothetical protein [Niabella beijingensis]